MCLAFSDQRTTHPGKCKLTYRVSSIGSQTFLSQLWAVARLCAVQRAGPPHFSVGNALPWFVQASLLCAADCGHLLQGISSAVVQ